MTEPSDPNAQTQSGTPADNLSVLGNALEHACLELLSDYGLQARIQEERLPTDTLTLGHVAAVDFSGQELRGVVVLSANQGVIVETTRGAAGMQGTGPGLSDWTCELANQLVGRVKNKLRSYNVSIDVSMPRLLSGSSVDQLNPGVRYRFRCEAGTFSGFLEVLIAPGVVLKEQTTDEALPQEGDLVFL